MSGPKPRLRLPLLAAAVAIALAATAAAQAAKKPPAATQKQAPAAKKPAGGQAPASITDETEDPAVWGKNFPLQYDDLPQDRRPGADALRRQRGAAAHARRGRPALGRRRSRRSRRTRA